MNFYPILIIVITISIFSSFVPYEFSIGSPSNSLSSYEKNCNNDFCIVTTCYNNQPCATTGLNNNTPTRDKTSPIFTTSDSESKNFDIVDLFKSFLNFK
jgi:hypothetical protein